MNNTDPKHLITHIDSAKTWLDKAKEEYIESNAVGAGMHLNLAQAEVKYAWELSRTQNVSKMDETFKKRQYTYWIPAAAVFAVIALGTVMGLQWMHTPKAGGNTIAAQPVQPSINEKAAIPEALLIKPSVHESRMNQSVEKLSSVAVTPKDLNMVSTPKVSHTDTERTKVLKNVSNAVPVNSSSENIKTVASNTLENIRTPESPAVVRPQPVSEIHIDEEALTREASKSLRLGK